MIKEMKLIPVTEKSHPFITAVNACELESHGFVEEEFFQTGTAKPFSPVLLKELYGSLDHYRELAAVSAKNAVAKGFVLPEDEAFLVEETVKIAAARGLS